MSVWLNHYETRAFLIRELCIMEIDDEGQWVDHPIDEAEWVEDELCPIPPPVPKKWLRELDLESEAEADALNAQVPGIGSRRSDVNESAPAEVEQIFPVPAEDQVPLPNVPRPPRGIPNTPEPVDPNELPDPAMPATPDDPNSPASNREAGRTPYWLPPHWRPPNRARSPSGTS